MVLGSNHYLYAQREEFRREPLWHSHQLAAVEGLIAQAADCQDEADFIERTGRFFLLARAAMQDRAANQLMAARSVDDPWLSEAAEAELARLASAESNEALYTFVLHPAKEKAARFALLTQQLFSLPLETKPILEELLSLDASLPSFPARFRWRFPWPIKVVREWLGWPEEDLAPAPPVYPWPAPGRAEEAPASSFDLYCARPWPEPLLQREAYTARRILAAVHSATAIEATSQALQLHFSITACWNQLFLDTLLAPLAAIEGVEEVLQFSHRLSGIVPQAVWDLPRVQFFREQNLRLELPEDFGALAGEAGFPFYFCPLPGWRDRKIECDLPHQPQMLFFRDQSFDPTRFVIPSCL